MLLLLQSRTAALAFCRSSPSRRAQSSCLQMTMKMSTNIIPRAAVSVVVRSPGPSYILVQRGKEPNKGFWSLPGGKLEGGETTLQGGMRELKEECQISTGLQWFSEGAITVTDSIHHDDNGKLLFHYVIAQCFAVASSELPLIASDDADDASWFNHCEIRTMVETGQATPGVLEVVERAELMYQKGLVGCTVVG
jgi:8-oxo-dGTP diphosphatase